jgi:hypothetical protein
MFWFVPYISHPVWNFTPVAYSLKEVLPVIRDNKSNKTPTNYT